MAQNQVVGIAVTAGGREILGRIPFLTLHDTIDDLKEELGEIWQTASTIVFCLPLETIVKLIAPFLAHSPIEVAVIAINASATHVISVLGESYLVPQIAALLQAQPIGADLTTTGIKPVDQWGLAWGWQLGKGDWQGINHSLNQGEKIPVLQESGSPLWKRALPPGHNLIFPDRDEPSIRVFISHRTRRLESYQAQWHPRVLWLGLECAPNTPSALIGQAIQTACQIHYLAEAAIAGIATPDRYPRLAEIAQERGWLYQSQLLPPEALALQGAGKDARLLAPSQVFHHSHQEGTVTIAIALAAQEYIGQEGHLAIMAGNLQTPTLQERECLWRAEVIMAPALPPPFGLGKILETTINYPLAVSLAQGGLRVVLVNDRVDLVIAHLFDRGWDGHNPQLEVIPGVSQIQRAAAQLGTVLQENFCVINLHGGEAPEGTLQRRVEAAAISDLVIAILEPCTPLRLTPLILSLEILRHYRSVTTPVAVLTGGQITISPLNQVDIKPIDRDTVILVGNEFSQFYNWSHQKSGLGHSNTPID